MHIVVARAARTAVLLSLLGACSIDPGVPTLPDDPDALLTDEQLRAPQEFAPVPVDQAWDAWIRANHHVVRSLTSRHFDDLQFLKPIIGSRRLVQLGESGHGVREFNLAKLRLIRFLHEEMGFDVLAFESGLFDCYHANLMTDEDPTWMMRRCLFGVWHTDELHALFEYVMATRKTERPLTITGFDIQISSASGTSFAPGFLWKVVSQVDSAYAYRVRELDIAFYDEYNRITRATGANTAARADSMVAVDQRLRLTARYDSVIAFVDANEPRLRSAYPEDPKAPLMARRTALSRMQFIRMLSARAVDESFVVRDEGMAGNIDFLLDQLHPGKKVIVWAHNAHIMHDREGSAGMSGGRLGPRSMGAWIAERRRPELYTIGLFMYRGSATTNTRQVYQVTRALDNSLEAVLYRPRKYWIFTDLLGQARVAGNGWMFQSIPAKEWGTNDFRMVPRAQFDGILFIDEVSPPSYR